MHTMFILRCIGFAAFASAILGQGEASSCPNTYVGFASNTVVSSCQPTMQPSPSVSASPSATPSIYPTLFIKYSYSIHPRPSQFVFPVKMLTSASSSLVFPKANYTILRDPAKLQELQIILACILLLPLESIEIADIAANSVSIPFDPSIPRLRSNGEIVCITLPSVAPTQSALRNQQIADTTVSYNILNPNNLFLIDKDSFATLVATDPSMLSYANSIGSGNPTAIPPYVLFTRINPDPVVVPAQKVSAGEIVGGIFVGILIFIMLSALAFVVVRIHNSWAHSRTAVKPSTSVSVNPLNSLSKGISPQPPSNETHKTGFV